MDELDRKLIGLLQQDGRASNASLARQVGVSEGTVRRRLKRLIQEGIIRVVALPDPQRMGQHTEALVGIQADPNQIEAAAGQLARLEETQWAATTTGAYDIFVWVAVSSPEKLRSLLREQVGAIPGVRRTETFVALSVQKRAHTPVA